MHFVILTVGLAMPSTKLSPQHIYLQRGQAVDSTV